MSTFSLFIVIPQCFQHLKLSVANNGQTVHNSNCKYLFYILYNPFLMFITYCTILFIVLITNYTILIVFITSYTIFLYLCFMHKHTTAMLFVTTCIPPCPSSNVCVCARACVALITSHTAQEIDGSGGCSSSRGVDSHCCLLQDEAGSCSREMRR